MGIATNVKLFDRCSHKLCAYAEVIQIGWKIGYRMWVKSKAALTAQKNSQYLKKLLNELFDIITCRHGTISVFGVYFNSR